MLTRTVSESKDLAFITKARAKDKSFMQYVIQTPLGGCTGAPTGLFAGGCNLWLIAPTFLLQCMHIKEKNWCSPTPL